MMAPLTFADTHSPTTTAASMTRRIRLTCGHARTFIESLKLQPDSTCANKAQHGALTDIDVPAKDCNSGKRGQYLGNDSIGHDLPGPGPGRFNRLDLGFVDFFNRFIKKLGAKPD